MIRLRGEWLAALAVTSFAAALIVLPLGLLVVRGLAVDGGLSIAPLKEALESPAVRRALLNSLDSAFCSALLASLVGTALALLVGLTDLRAKGLFVFLLLVPMMIPPHVTAISWIQAAGPSSPLLRTLGLAPEIGTTHPLYSRAGVIALLALQHMPLVLLVVRAALRAQPRELSDAARVAGAGPARVIWRIVLPILAPAVIAGFALAFVSALKNFGIPALLGVPAHYITLPVLMWQRMASFGVSILQNVAVIGTLMVAVAIAATVLLTLLQRRTGAALTGPPRQPLSFSLGRVRPFAEAGLALFIVAVVALPLAALFATALVKTYGLPLTAATATLANFGEVVLRQGVTLRAFANSALAAGGAALTLGAFAIVLAHLAAKSGLARRVSGAVGAAGDIAYALPGIVVSIAFIVTFVAPLPLVGVSLYNTLMLIALAYLAAFLAIAVKPVAAAFAQLDPALEDAARIAGAGYRQRMTRIVTPLLAPAAASAAILVFLTAYNEITVSALLWSFGNETIGTTIFNYEDGGYTTLAAAMSAVTVVATLALMLLLDRMGRRLPPGTVPWR